MNLTTMAPRVRVLCCKLSNTEDTIKRKPTNPTSQRSLSSLLVHFISLALRYIVAKEQRCLKETSLSHGFCPQTRRASIIIGGKKYDACPTVSSSISLIFWTLQWLQNRQSTTGLFGYFVTYDHTTHFPQITLLFLWQNYWEMYFFVTKQISLVSFKTSSENMIKCEGSKIDIQHLTVLYKYWG